MLHFLAWLVIILSGLGVFLGPLFIGQEREKYTYATWVSKILEFVMLLPLVHFVITH